MLKTVLTDTEIMATFDVMKQLRPHLNKETYLETIKNLQSRYGYHLLAVFENGEARAATGYRITESLAWGKYLYVDDLITDEKYRSNGYAKQLFDYLDEEVSKYNCVGMHLDSGVHRFDAHRFYLNRKMNITSHHFQKQI